MAVTAADVKAFAPELAAVADAIVTLWIGWAPGAVSPSVMLTNADQATLLYVAHHLTRSAGGAAGTVGAVTSRSVGDVSTANAPGPVDDAASLHTTAYGVALWQLMRRRTAGGAVV